MAPDDEWFPEGYSPEISAEEWLALLHDKDVCKEESLILLKCLKDSGGAASCKQLSQKYGRHAQVYNLAGSRLAKKVALKTGCPVLQRENGKTRWWPVLFLGRYAEGNKEEGYIWKLRPELAEALEHYDLSAIPLFENAGMNKMPIINENAEITDEYRRAAEMLLAISHENGIDTDAIAHEAEKKRLQFVERFSPEKLRAIPDDKLLGALYLTQPSTKEYMMHYLEAKTRIWGSISGGSSCKFGLFQREKDHHWVNASKKVLTEDEALAYARDVREKLIEGSHFFENLNLSNREEIVNLDTAIESIFGKSFKNMWIQKYFALLYPDKVSGFYSQEWQNHVLHACSIQPNNQHFARSAQIARIANHNGWYYPEFFHVFTSRFGKSPKKFYKVSSEVGGHIDLEKEQKDSLVAIAWPKIGPLKDTHKKTFTQKVLTARLQSEYFPQDSKTAARKARELTTFCDAENSSVFVYMHGEKPLAFIDNLGSYFYSDDPTMAHCRRGEWHFDFTEDERLPDREEGISKSCIEFKNHTNLIYLYKKYFGLANMAHSQVSQETPKAYPYAPSPIENKINFQLPFPSTFPKNRIIFGAPGTGKSHKLKEDSEEYFHNNIERVTFHPDYAYSHFVGCYKPQTSQEGHIRYDFVPGPFLRVLVRALRSGMEGQPQPHLLLIEEINRARVAAVFGDAFQLLDRAEEGYSEYDIAVSEDVKEYLRRELGCAPEDCERIRIPGNMFIWATMNSADQGVFPMDTAFKRRWTFEYLPVDPVNPPDVLIPLKIEGNIANISWNDLRGAINDRLSSLRINEDKLIGPYFLKPSALEGDENRIIKDSDGFKEIFKNKILMYLFEDAVRHQRNNLFKGHADCNRYSSLCKSFDNHGLSIFGDDFTAQFSKK